MEPQTAEDEQKDVRPSEDVLSPEDKQRIRAEEMYRNELRAQLQEPKSFSSWVFMNSPFGLWLFSSVLLALFGWAFAEIAAQRSAAADRSKQIRKIAVEVVYRCQLAKQDIAAAKNKLDGTMIAPIDEGLHERALASLLYELKYLAHETANDAIEEFLGRWPPAQGTVDRNLIANLEELVEPLAR